MARILQYAWRQTEWRDGRLRSLMLGLISLLFVAVFLAFTLVPWAPLASLNQSGLLLRVALLGLALLVALTCLHLSHIGLKTASMKSVLLEIRSMASSGKHIDQMLPVMVEKLSLAGGADCGQIGLLEKNGSALKIRAVFAPAGVTWNPAYRAMRGLEDLPLLRRALEKGEPCILSAAQLRMGAMGEGEALFLSGGWAAVASVVIIPMIHNGQAKGVLILGQKKKRFRSLLSSPRMARTLMLAGDVAEIMEQVADRGEALHDPLTGLYNRRHFSLRLQEEIVRARRDKQVIVILLCDMDHFRQVNDTSGHKKGDEALQAIAKSLQSSTRGTDLVFRWGGDEMVVILSNSTREGGLQVARRIREGIRHTGAGIGHQLGVSVGVALYPEHGAGEDELLSTADRALYIAKKSGRGIHVGEEEYQLNSDSIKVVYQPIVDTVHNKIIGYEALTRDPCDKLNVSQFFKKYRVIGQLAELKELIFTSQVKLSQELGLQRVFINADFDVLSKIKEIPPLDGTEVVIELSELEALHDLEKHLVVAERWRRHGYRFAIDDFGAGFISLPFLAMLIPDYVKVDRSTILQAVASEKFRRFLKTLLHGVRAYATTGIVAEGVEKERELKFVDEMGITLVQGYLFGHPEEMTAKPQESISDGLPVTPDEDPAPRV